MYHMHVHHLSSNLILFLTSFIFVSLSSIDFETFQLNFRQTVTLTYVRMLQRFPKTAQFKDMEMRFDSGPVVVVSLALKWREILWQLLNHLISNNVP